MTIINNQSTHDSLLIQDHQKVISEQIQSGENPQIIENYITNVETSFGVSLDTLRQELAISVYNQDPNNLAQLLPAMKKPTKNYLDNQIPNNPFSSIKDQNEGIITFLDQIKDIKTFRLQLSTLSYGSPLVHSIFIEALKNKKSNCI